MLAVVALKQPAVGHYVSTWRVNLAVLVCMAHNLTGWHKWRHS